MENINIGIANIIVSNKLRNSYFNETSINESKKLAFDLLETVKSSPILQLEFKVFNNIANKHIDDDQSATRYIDNNIKLFEVYTNEEIKTEREKLNQFISESEIPSDDKVKLYSAISTLIEESLKVGNEIDVDNIHESFTYVLNHIKTPKNTLVENVEQTNVNEDVIEIAVGKFNDKYVSLDESDRNLLKTLIKSTTKEKESLLESYKSETLEVLESINEAEADDHIAKAMAKIREMVYNAKSVDDDIIGLHEFKKELL